MLQGKYIASVNHRSRTDLEGQLEIHIAISVCTTSSDESQLPLQSAILLYLTVYHFELPYRRPTLKPMIYITVAYIMGSEVSTNRPINSF